MNQIQVSRELVRSNRFSIGDELIIVEMTPRWWRHPIRWIRHKLQRRHVLVVTAVDRDTGTITMDSE